MNLSVDFSETPEVVFAKLNKMEKVGDIKLELYRLFGSMCARWKNMGLSAEFAVLCKIGNVHKDAERFEVEMVIDAIETCTYEGALKMKEYLLGWLEICKKK